MMRCACAYKSTQKEDSAVVMQNVTKIYALDESYNRFEMAAYSYT